uniref:Uncharacterized protein n=1 Tax=Candidatus Kentrum sp. TC TaxID=2126339 RepID=A0A450YLB1_9GAMM|nr:MAG: hypothetical protein BECKTC1821E_GA0114239_101826 [Candidatus Kentron sp. TC]
MKETLRLIGETIVLFLSPFREAYWNVYALEGFLLLITMLALFIGARQAKRAFEETNNMALPPIVFVPGYFIFCIIFLGMLAGSHLFLVMILIISGMFRFVEGMGLANAKLILADILDDPPKALLALLATSAYFMIAASMVTFESLPTSKQILGILHTIMLFIALLGMGVFFKTQDNGQREPKVLYALALFCITVSELITSESMKPDPEREGDIEAFYWLTLLYWGHVAMFPFGFAWRIHRLAGRSD